jgi:hypothetical protein
MTAARSSKRRRSFTSTAMFLGSFLLLLPTARAQGTTAAAVARSLVAGDVTGWIGTTAGLYFDRDTGGGLIGWEAGLVKELDKVGIGLGAGAKVAYAGSWQLVVPLRLVIPPMGNGGRMLYAQAGPMRMGGQWGVDGELGVDWMYGAFYVGAFHTPGSTSFVLGTRLSVTMLVILGLSRLPF